MQPAVWIVWSLLALVAAAVAGCGAIEPYTGPQTFGRGSGNTSA